MKKWIRIIIASIVMFSLIFILVYNIIELPDKTSLNSNTQIMNSDKLLASFTVTVMITVIILEVVNILLYFENRAKKEKNRLVIFFRYTFILIVIFSISYFVYQKVSMSKVVKVGENNEKFRYICQSF